MSKIQYTIRDVPTEVDLQLRAAAAQQGISLNRLVLQKLGAAKPAKAKRYHDLDWMIGAMPADEVVELDTVINEARATARAQAQAAFFAEKQT